MMKTLLLKLSELFRRTPKTFNSGIKANDFYPADIEFQLSLFFYASDDEVLINNGKGRFILGPRLESIIAQ